MRVGVHVHVAERAACALLVVYVFRGEPLCTSTVCVLSIGRNTFLNVNKNDNYKYEKTLVGNWVEERHDFPRSPPIGGTIR